MKPKRRFKPYVRLYKKGDKGVDLRTAIRLNFFSDEELKLGKLYVMVQRGFPHRVLSCGLSKRVVKDQILLVASKDKAFSEWAEDLHSNCVTGKWRGCNVRSFRYLRRVLRRSIRLKRLAYSNDFRY